MDPEPKRVANLILDRRGPSLDVERIEQRRPSFVLERERERSARPLSPLAGVSGIVYTRSTSVSDLNQLSLPGLPRPLPPGTPEYPMRRVTKQHDGSLSKRAFPRAPSVADLHAYSRPFPRTTSTESFRSQDQGGKSLAQMFRERLHDDESSFASTSDGSDISDRKRALSRNNSFRQGLAKRDNNYALHWRNLKYTVGVRNPAYPSWKYWAPRKEKRILNGVTGYVCPGQLLAIMGPSGSGKTSLLNILAGRMDGGELRGDIKLNGHRVPQKTLKRNCGYVMQDDLLFNFLTVEEILTFTRQLKGVGEHGAKTWDVEGLLEELGLLKCRNTVVGGMTSRGISGGERKRANIANELICNPAMLFMDEPTSGLDSATAQSLIETLDDLAKYNYSIDQVCTIHQARASIFNLFHNLMILSGGSVVYFGPARDVQAYFSGLNFICPMYFNVADFVVDLSTVDRRSKAQRRDSSRRLKALKAVYRHSDYYGYAKLDLSQMSTQPPPDKFKTGATFCQQFVILFHRAAKSAYRNMESFVRLGGIAFFVLIMGVLYLNIGTHYPGSVQLLQDRQGVIFVNLLVLMFAFGGAQQKTFPVERMVFWKEHESNMYSVIPYFLTKVLAELPVTIAGTILLSTLLYWMVGLNPDTNAFLIYIGFIFIHALVAEGFQTFVAILVKKESLRDVVTGGGYLLWILGGGSLVNVHNCPKALAWLLWISWIRYVYEALIVNEFQGREFMCSADIAPFIGIPGICSGDTVIANMGFETGIYLRNALILIGMILFWRGLSVPLLVRVKPTNDEAE